MNKEDLNDEGITKLAELLSKLEPGFFPLPIFHEITRLTVSPIIEVVPLRRSKSNELEILLLKREQDDPIWPGQLHTPGTGIRATDEPGSFETAFRRIMSDELKGVETTEPAFVKNILHHSGRGMEASQIFWVEVKAESHVGQFYKVSHLPDSLVQSQLDFIPSAIEAYEKAGSK